MMIDSHRLIHLTLPLVSCRMVGTRNHEDRKEAIVWARGCIAAGGPYLLISYVPYLSVLAIWFVASQSLVLGFATGQHIEIGTTWVNDSSGRLRGKIGTETGGLRLILLEKTPSNQNFFSLMAA